jgi:hypothetical protein
MAAAKSGFPAPSLADSWLLAADPVLGAGLFSQVRPPLE